MIVHDGTNLIKDEIKLKCRADISKENDIAKQKTDAINSEADAKIKAMKDKIISDAIKDADSQANRIRSRTNVEVKDMVSRARESITDAIISDAIEEFKRTDAERMKKVIGGLLLDSISRTNGEAITVISDKRTLDSIDLKMIESACGERKIKVAKEEKDVGGGFIVFDEANNMYIDCTFGALVRAKEDAVRKRIFTVIS